MAHRLPHVFVPQFTQRDPRDISDLGRYGVVEILFDRHLYPDDVDEAMPQVMTKARERLLEFQPHTDFLALVGSPLYVAACTFVLGVMFALEPAKICLLRYDRHENAYYPLYIGERYAGPCPS